MGADQGSKWWVDRNLGTEEHPVILEINSDSEGKPLSQVATEQFGVPEGRLEALIEQGYRPLMRLDPETRVRPDEPAFAPAGTSIRRGISYWVFDKQRLDVPPRRLPGANELGADSVEFLESTVRAYLGDKLGPVFSEAELDTLVERFTFAVDYTRVLPSDSGAAGETYLLLDRALTLIPGFAQLRYAENPGAAWGLLSTASAPFRRRFFLTVSTLALAVVLALYHRLRGEQRAPKFAAA